LRYLLQDKDYLFNLAGQTSHLDSMRNPMPDLEIHYQTELGWAPQRALRDTIEATLRYFRDSMSHYL
jgi:hypothetical protein